MKNLKSNVYFKIAVIAILILVLMIPAVLVQSLVYERESIQRSAIAEVSEKWGNGQKLHGPYISIPYNKYIKTIAEKDSVAKVTVIKDWIYLLPESLNIEGDISPEKRYRSIYEIVVYESDIKLSGVFSDFDFTQLGVERKDIHFDKASLNIGITDLKGIQKQIDLNWANQKTQFNAGLSTRGITTSGINAPVKIDLKESEKYSFSFELSLNGSQFIYFTPVGKTTDVSLKSTWDSPKFTGKYLPDEREVSQDGFDATWNILHLNRNYPQKWLSSTHNISSSSFGTDLLLPVDNYTKVNRIVKYAILFLCLTFLVFFFVEILNSVFIHPIQYLLVGIALVIFYTLLLSISEHITFNFAYIISAGLTLGLISAYTYAILKSKEISLLIAGILLITYTFIFIIIQLEDYALLIGSIGIFLILAIVMYFSRKIDWYNIRIAEESDQAKVN